MLKELKISNFALIKDVVFRPDKGLNIITGETGAGKSILLDALSLVLGERADIKTQSEFGEKCVVEAVFDISALKLQDSFTAMDIDYADETIIRREISPAGKSRTFVNDTPVPLTALKTLASQLVNIHSQHENTDLNTFEFQAGLVDHASGISSKVAGFRQLFSRYKAQQQQLENLKTEQARLIKERDYLQFLYDELEQANITAGEEQQIEQEITVLGNADEIELQTTYISERLYGESHSMVDQLAELRNRLKPLSNVSAEFNDAYKRLDQLAIEAKDLSKELEVLRQSANPDPEKLNALNERLQLFQNLKRKHAVTEADALPEIYNNLGAQLLVINNIDAEVLEKAQQVASIEAELSEQAAAISKARSQALRGIESKVIEMLEGLELKQAAFKIKLEALPEGHFNEHGADYIQFYFSANIGMPLQPLNKVASGGELARLTLSFKSLIASNAHLPTLIFDEIDTGVSGEVAHKIGLMMMQMGASHQVIAITHLPQVAAKGRNHFFVYKDEKDGQTISSLRKLSADERVMEIAKILSGNKPGDKAVANAKELLSIS